MDKKEKIQLIDKKLEEMSYMNQLSPFPVFDTEHIDMLKEERAKLAAIEDKTPVEACGTCKSLYLVNEDDGHVVCMRCGSVNHVEKYDNIEQYLKVNN